MCRHHLHPSRSNSIRSAFDPRFIQSLLLDKFNLKSKDYASGVEVVLKNSKIPEDEIASHIVDIYTLHHLVSLPLPVQTDSSSNPRLTPSAQSRVPICFAFSYALSLSKLQLSDCSFLSTGRCLPSGSWLLSGAGHSTALPWLHD